MLTFLGLARWAGVGDSDTSETIQNACSDQVQK